MKITSAIPLASARAFLVKDAPLHVTVRRSVDGPILAVAWKFGSDDRLYSLAKRLGGLWNPAAGGWTFPNGPDAAQDFFDTVVKKHPDWQVIDRSSHSQQFLAGLRISSVPLPDGNAACLVQLPLPHFTEVGPPAGRCFELAATSGEGRKVKQKVGLLVGRVDDVAKFFDCMLRQGAVEDDSLAVECGVSSGASALRVTLNGWAVEIACDLASLLHYLIAPPQKAKWVGQYPNSVAVDVQWDGTIHTTRKLWAVRKEEIERAGLSWKGDDPGLEPALPAPFHESLAPGWHTSAPNGHLLHQYQKDGALFCARRGMRALIGDEMGVG